MYFNERSLVIVDLETTGLDPTWHEVLEVGALRVNQDTLEIEDRFDSKIIPYYIERASPMSLQVNGYTREAWADASPHHKVWSNFFAFAKDGVFCSYSTHFDWSFMREVIRNF